MANKLQSDAAEKEAKKQQIASMRMQLARDIDPSVPTYGYQAAQARSQMAAQRDAGQTAMIGSLLPVALQGLGQMTNTPDSTRSFSSNLNGALSGRLNDLNNQDMFGEINSRLGLRPWSDTY